MLLLLMALDRQLSLNLVIWVFPLAFLIHDTERWQILNRKVENGGEAEDVTFHGL